MEFLWTDKRQVGNEYKILWNANYIVVAHTNIKNGWLYKSLKSMFVTPVENTISKQNTARNAFRNQEIRALNANALIKRDN